MKQKKNQVLNKRTTYIIIIAALAVIIFIRNRQQEKTQYHNSNRQVQRIEVPALPGLELPAPNTGEQIVSHHGYTLSYNEKFELANWVSYQLTRQQASSSRYERTNQFTEDPTVSTGTASDEDYRGSGYDRGHLVPAEDMAWSATAMEESFYYSNVAPQLPAFNRGVWRRLEELTRFWASYYDSIRIVTGPVLSGSLSTIGKVSLPKYYYKVILEYNQNESKAIGFVLSNEASAATLKSFAVSVDSVEKLTGLDFFPRLPDDVEATIESHPAIGDWPWTRKKAGKTSNARNFGNRELLNRCILDFRTKNKMVSESCTSSLICSFALCGSAPTTLQAQ